MERDLEVGRKAFKARVAQQIDAEQRRQTVCENYIGWEHQEEPILAFLEIQVLYPFQCMLILFNFPKNVASIRNRYYPCHSIIDEEIEVHKRKWCAPGSTASGGGGGEGCGNLMVQLPGSAFCSLNHHALMRLPQGESDITGVKYLFLLTVGDYGTDPDLGFCKQHQHYPYMLSPALQTRRLRRFIPI